jgi:hypothetical protein
MGSKRFSARADPFEPDDQTALNGVLLVDAQEVGVTGKLAVPAWTVLLCPCHGALENKLRCPYLGGLRLAMRR